MRAQPLGRHGARGAGRGQPRGGAVGVGQPVLAAHHPQQRLEHEEISGAARVDHPGLAQRLELARGRLQRRAGRVDRALGDVVERPATDRLGPLGRRARDAEDGALDGARDARPGEVAGCAQGRGQRRTVERAPAGLLDDRGQAAHELAEDDAAVATGGDEHGPGQHGGRLGEAGRVRRREHAHGLLHGDPQVGARVAVGHREDVEPVKRRGVGREIGACRDEPPPQRRQVQLAQDRHDTSACCSHIRRARG
ncbi:hypothetical protein GCM10025872_23620 [Barrientosiimonas endolithica]|uniref:Uncharacterized protein n=1 Tax=Barrientosiimonas endolithica TaxID=1535208 RepID=A0ABM8HCW4_9MICO|nr:hypothetical protein [Barrientosiimonas endolithica]BDZ58705.1 hypothetical protein GCM10025872_23620 [Barrientosiimonas endolithica]